MGFGAGRRNSSAVYYYPGVGNAEICSQIHLSSALIFNTVTVDVSRYNGVDERTYHFDQSVFWCGIVDVEFANGDRLRFFDAL